MGTSHLVGLLAAANALALIATDTSDTEGPTPQLPANCIAQLGPPVSPPPPGWRDLLPQLVVGFEHQPERRRHSDIERDGFEMAPVAEFDERHRGTETTRWTVSLRWHTEPGRDEPGAAPLPESPESALCSEFLQLRRRRPQQLAEAIEQWTETARLLAIIERPESRETGHE